MATELKYNSQYAGAKAIAQNDKAQLRTSIGLDYAQWHTCKKGDYAICTGCYFELGNALYMQTTTNWYVIVPNGSDDWLFVEKAVKLKKYSQTQAQYIVDQIIKNNISILQNNLVCARYADKFTPEQRQQIRALQNRVKERNEALMDDSLIQTDKIRQSYPKGYADLEPYLNKLMQGESVGSVTWATVVVVALIIGAAATAVYFAYKVYYDQSETDVKYSKELTQILMSKLTEEEYQQLMSETQGIVTKARLRSAVGSYVNALRFLAYGIAGYAIYKFIKEKRKK